MTAEKRVELRALCEAATPGPWTSGPASPYGVKINMPDSWIMLSGKRRDARLIAAARTALPALLDELDAKDAEIARLADDQKSMQTLCDMQTRSGNTLAKLYEIMDAIADDEPGRIIAADRDHWKARAEALERAIKSPAVNEFNAPYCPACMTCAGFEHERNCGRECGEGRKGWQFDATCFGGEG